MQQDSEIEQLFAGMQDIRSGPRPLPMHFTMALIDNARRSPGNAYGYNDFVKMVSGIQKYLAHPYERITTDVPVVWKNGQAKLFYYAGSGKKQSAPLFIIPSMINRSYILDLMPDRSFVSYMCDKGFDVYLLDWGDAAQCDDMQTLEDVFANCLFPVAEEICERSGEAMHALGSALPSFGLSVGDLGCLFGALWAILGRTLGHLGPFKKECPREPHCKPVALTYRACAQNQTC